MSIYLEFIGYAMLGVSGIAGFCATGLGVAKWLLSVADRTDPLRLYWDAAEDEGEAHYGTHIGEIDTWHD